MQQGKGGVKAFCVGLSFSLHRFRFAKVARIAMLIFSCDFRLHHCLSDMCFFFYDRHLLSSASYQGAVYVSLDIPAHA